MENGSSTTGILGSRGDLPRADRDPSNMPRRIAAFLVASMAVVVACYLGSFQAGLIPSVWDPVFGEGSEKVLLSKPALLLRSIILIPDAGMGAIAYLGAAVYAIAGPRKRWLRRPWLALIFGANCLSLGLASTVLVLTQAFVIGEWCFLCLVAAACSYSLVILAAGELFATVKFLLGVWRSGGAAGAIRTAWLGRVEER
jgi:uncharacterized membrane protein